MKTIERISILFFGLILSSTSIFAQIKEVETAKPIEYKKHFHEINYKPIAALGYSYIRNFNNKFLLGSEVYFGIAYYVPSYADFLCWRLFVRNIFNKKKIDRKWNYDIGYYKSFSLYDRSLEGISFQISYDIWKFCIGLNLQTGFLRDSYGYRNIEFMNGFVLIPVLTFKFY